MKVNILLLLESGSGESGAFLPGGRQTSKETECWAFMSFQSRGWVALTHQLKIIGDHNFHQKQPKSSTWHIWIKVVYNIWEIRKLSQGQKAFAMWAFLHLRYETLDGLLLYLFLVNSRTYHTRMSRGRKNPLQGVKGSAQCLAHDEPLPMLAATCHCCPHLYY